MKTMALSLSVAMGLWIAHQTAAEGGDQPAGPTQTRQCCTRCGAPKVCKVVCQMEKVKKTVWVVECEEFCAPLPRCAPACEPCGECGKTSSVSYAGDPCTALRRPMVPPKCGKVRCRKKLVKKEITCEVPVYKCVVVCCCPQCPAIEGAGRAEAPTPAAPLPPVNAAWYSRVLGTQLSLK
jgi:hypothetical protein